MTYSYSNKHSKKPVGRPAKMEKASEVTDVDSAEDEADPGSAVTMLAQQVSALASMMAEQQRQTAAQFDTLRSALASGPQASRQGSRQAARPRNPGTVTVTGREGKLYTRRAFHISTDPLALPEEFIEEVKAEGYTLEWKRASIYNEPQEHYLATIQRDGGWEPVLNSRLPGLFPGAPDEAIRQESLILMERPAKLTEVARQEDHRMAIDQVRMRQNTWGVDSKREDYFTTDTAEAQKHTLLRTVREAADPSWSPSHDVASADEFM